MKHAMTTFFLGATTALAHGGDDAAAVQGETYWLSTGDHGIVLALAGLALARMLRPFCRWMDPCHRLSGADVLGDLWQSSRPPDVLSADFQQHMVARGAS